MLARLDRRTGDEQNTRSGLLRALAERELAAEQRARARRTSDRLGGAGEEGVDENMRHAFGARACFIFSLSDMDKHECVARRPALCMFSG